MANYKKNESLDQKKYSSLRNNVQPSQSNGINRTSRVSFNISVLNGEMDSLQHDEPFGTGKTQKSSIMKKPPGLQLQSTISELTLGSSRAVRVAQSPEEDSAFEKTRLGKFLSFIDPIVVGLIFLNSITIGIGTLDEIEQNDSAREAFEIVDSVFLYIFSVEVVLTSIHFLRLDRVQLDPVSKVPTMPTMSKREKRKRSKALPWLIFDIFVIGFSWLFREGSIVRAFRILRAVRLINKVQSLKNLTRALLHVMPKMGALLFITIVLLLVFGIMCTFLFKDLYAEGKTTYDYFGRVDLSLLTLFQMMSFDNWHNPAREVMETYVWSWTIMVLWVFISGFVITNLIVAIVCESLIQLDTIGVKALTGQPLPNDEYSINDRGTSPSSNPNDATISERLMQLETAVAQLLNEENAILEELGKLKQKSHSE